MSADTVLKLTALSSCAGCASKLSRQALTQVLHQLPMLRDRNVLVGAATGDDAGVYRLDRDRALVQTTDFFTPIVDDPYSYGQIAAANALSDVYAMGGRPLTALALVGIPADLVPLDLVNRILRGGADKIKEAECVLLGGHTIKVPEPIYGFAVTGLVSPRRIMTNANARPGDTLILTKPLGTGIVTTAVKRGLANAALENETIRVMSTLNTIGAELAELGLVRAAIDVTGFGLLSHLSAVCRESHVGAEISAARVPVIGDEVFELISANCIPGGSRDNLEYANAFTVWDGATEAQKTLLTDAQTSGGLLLCVSQKHLKSVLKRLRPPRALCAAAIGQIVRSAKPRIWVRA
ncbi:MAG TPA: selenide, water dikinase SelD [Candidatus Acidoferrales bacterium]|nr:selenide, water dikinase SelD [Candidatus Acidoferrales bacterium]